MALLFAEHKLKIKSKGDPHVRKPDMSILSWRVLLISTNYSPMNIRLRMRKYTGHYDNSNCHRNNCRYDHDIIDCTRIEKLARWTPRGMSDYEYLTVECKATNGRIRWKIIIKPDALQDLKTINPIAQTIPSPPFEYEDDGLLTVIK
jgi:hypothetical protein